MRATPLSASRERSSTAMLTHAVGALGSGAGATAGAVEALAGVLKLHRQRAERDACPRLISLRRAVREELRSGAVRCSSGAPAAPSASTKAGAAGVARAARLRAVRERGDAVSPLHRFGVEKQPDTGRCVCVVLSERYRSGYRLLSVCTDLSCRHVEITRIAREKVASLNAHIHLSTLTPTF